MIVPSFLFYIQYISIKNLESANSEFICVKKRDKNIYYWLMQLYHKIKREPYVLRHGKDQAADDPAPQGPHQPLLNHHQVRTWF